MAHLEVSPIRIGIISNPEELKRHVIAFHIQHNSYYIINHIMIMNLVSEIII